MVTQAPHFKKLTVSGDIDSNRELRTKIERANETLLDVVVPSAGTTKVEWTNKPGPARNGIQLKLAEWTGYVVNSFDRPDFDNPHHLRWQIHKIWGARSKKQLAELISHYDAAG